MADLTKRIIFIVLYWTCETTLVSAHYCNWGSCTPDEECCAHHKCCLKSSKLHKNEIAYVVIWILAGVMIAITCGHLYKYKNQLWKIFIKQSGDKIPFAA